MHRLVALSFLIFIGLPSIAAERVEIFSAAVQVDSQQESDRELAFLEALKQVIVKISGDSAYLEEPLLDSILSSPRRYVEGFSYQRNPRFTGQSVDFLDREVVGEATSVDSYSEKMTPEREYVLRVQFEETALIQNVREIGLPVWGALRPSILAWVVMQREGERHLINSDYPDIMATLKSEAERFGLPVFLPVGDLQDLSEVNLDELWGLFPSAVEKAGQRYPSDFKLLARVYEADEGLELKWNLLAANSVLNGRAQAIDYRSLWRQSSEDIARELSKQFAVVSDPTKDAQELVLVVSGIERFVDYAKMVEHLESLSSVDTALVRRVSQDKVDVLIRLHGSRGNFEQQVELAGKMQAIMPDFFPETDAVAGGGVSPESDTSSPIESAYFYWLSSRENL